MKIEHTPGDWEILPNGDICSALKTTVDFGGTTGERQVQLIIGKVNNYTGHGAEARANARLMVTSPKLLAALEGLLKQAEIDATVFPRTEQPRRNLVLAEARAAIAKATKTTP